MRQVEAFAGAGENGGVTAKASGGLRRRIGIAQRLMIRRSRPAARRKIPHFRRWIIGHAKLKKAGIVLGQISAGARAGAKNPARFTHFRICSASASRYDLVLPLALSQRVANAVEIVGNGLFGSELWPLFARRNPMQRPRMRRSEIGARFACVAIRARFAARKSRLAAHRLNPAHSHHFLRIGHVERAIDGEVTNRSGDQHNHD